MKFLIVGLLILGLGSVKTEPDQSDETKKGKMFSLFSVVTFPNSQCTTKSDKTMYGTCFTASECGTKGGSADGNCAAGFGVCCTFSTSTCGKAITQNCSYISNPSYPSTYTTTGSCSHAVTPVNSDICQIRLDFDNFDITEVTTTGVCTDSFTITGPSGQNPHVLCGTLTNSHIYVENARSTTATTLSFTIATGGTWKIKIAQIECSSTSRAYPDCDQFITGVTGTVSSYNWANVQLKNKFYTHCIRKEAGYCGIQYTQAVPATSPDSFQTHTAQLNGAVTTATLGYITLPGCITGNGGCDYAGIALIDSKVTTQTEPGTVLAANHMFRIDHTQNNVAQTVVGFKLQYVQIPCGGVIAEVISDH